MKKIKSFNRTLPVDVSGKEIDRVLLITLLLSYLILGQIKISQYYAPVTGVDDIGYWGIAYWIAFGRQIAEVSYLSYYSYGYSILLAPFVRIIREPVTLFRAIIFLNLVLNTITFINTRSLIKKITPSHNVFATISAFFAINYVSYFCYSRWVLTESLLTCLFAILCNLLFDAYARCNYMKLVLAGIICVYMHYVHQRTIAIVISFVISIFFYTFIEKKLNPRQLITILAVIIIFFTVGNCIKEDVLSNVYYAKVNASNAVEVANNTSNNDYSGNITKAVRILTNYNELKYFTISLIEKVYYFVFSTILIGAFGVIRCFKLFFGIGKNSRATYLFLGLSFFLSFCIAAVFMHGGLDSRYEAALYGRYTEFIYFIFIALGLLEIADFRKIVFLRELGGISIFIFVAEICLKTNYEIENISYSMSWLTPGMFSIFYNFKDISKSIDFIFFITKVALIIFFMFACASNKYMLLVAFLVVAMISWTMNIFDMENVYISAQKNMYDRSSPIVTIIDKNNIDETYYIASTKTSKQRVKIIQFLCPNNNLVRINDIDDVDYKRLNSFYLLTENLEMITESIPKNSFECIFENDSFCLYRYAQ